MSSAYRLLALLFLPVSAALAQSPAPPDTVAKPVVQGVRLSEATVVGYGQNLPLRRTAAAVGVVGASTIERFSEASLTQAVNTLPGVRLEERATASYRLSVRGSTLRSPFGVRNVKVYYEGIPFTEASGSTPLNILDAGTLGRIEVIKGPAASVYGAGTGGAVLLSNRRPWPNSTRTGVGFTAGSFGLRRYTATAETADSTHSLRAQYARQTLDGYRQNSAQRRDVLTLDGEWAISDKQTVGVHVLYSDLFYQLPGSLTRAQFYQNPRQARPSTATQPGTVEQRADYRSRTALLGATHEYRFTAGLSNTTTLYTTAAVIRTPFLVDFERNTQVGLGGRTVFNYRTLLLGRPLRVQAGGEVQNGFENARNYQNRGGTPGPLRYDDEVRTATGFAFSQADWELPANFLLTVGASYNRLRYRIYRVLDATVQPNTSYNITRNFRPEVSPRVALLREFGQRLSVYGSVSTGFSPPSEEEIRPSDASLNSSLQAERGTSYEVGARGKLLDDLVTFDVALYDFRLRQTIVTRTTEQGAVLFANAGNTRQRGAEVALSGWLWRVWRPSENVIDDPTFDLPMQLRENEGLRVWASYAYNNYLFGRYESGGNNFSGNRLTGAAPHTLTAGANVGLLGFYLTPTLSHQARLPLNDANTEYAPGYWTFAARTGWRHNLLRERLAVDVYAGIENATDRRYSLGNDLNAFGSRYFQPAPGRNYYGGLTLGWRW
ncbi:TonB-dependent receptor family protein [Hymenobacter koreensis]|uniref:TonB-dependent receptor PqqU n=1 Tax=Hymenobacter koreensis TaxID=1084523 RepID=A0ABP8IZ58_9BACT